MKILRITVNNIASLAGIQTVDFTKEPLRSAGLFGISGATGAGKSSLLDAVCLALFDATPRLRHVGILGEIHEGEKQNDRRNLLRRGTASGFAEVAFVGVDQQSWTARWSVRRSRNQPDGRLQSVERTLYRGNIPPGTDGVVEAGGKKTLVQQAIVDRIGLTFEQFTRAVLLAQNEFATFLKASDRERAEILQALTGTEQFERISCAVFARAAREKKDVEAVQLKLSGNEPLSAEERRQAEETRIATQQRVQQAEQGLEVVKRNVVWFEQRAALQKQLQQAEQQQTLAQQQRDDAAPRRQELEQTEYVLREARTLWTTRLDRHAAATKAQTEVQAATEQITQRTAQLRDVSEQLTAASAALQTMTVEAQQTQQQLKSARALDARLKPLEERLTTAATRLQAAEQQHSRTVESLAAATAQQEALWKDHRDRERQLEEVSDFAAFANDAARWNHLLAETMAARIAADDAAKQLSRTTDQRTLQTQTVDRQRAIVRQAEQDWTSAQQQRQSAEQAERDIDLPAIATRREGCHHQVQLLQKLDRQLQRRTELSSDTATLSAELTELKRLHQQQSTRLAELTERLLPGAEQETVTARALLQRMEAAIDDHARRLRATLQDEQPCPVCGSHEHPYRAQQPNQDADSVAISEAQRHLHELAQRQETLLEESRQLRVDLESTSVRMEERTKRRQECEQALELLVFDEDREPLIAEILALEPTQQQPAVLQQLSISEQRLTSLAEQERSGRQATARTRTARDAEQQQRDALEHHRRELAAQEKQLTLRDADVNVADQAATTANSRLQDAVVELGTLWSGLPDARRQFDADGPAFCDRFAAATATCRSVSEQLQIIRSDLKSVESRLTPLRDAVQLSTQLQAECRAEHSSAVTARDELLQERQTLFDGRAADDVEAELAAQRKAAEQSVRDLTAMHHQHDKDRQAAEQNRQNAARTATDATSAAQQADAQLLAWLDHFNERYQCQHSMADLEQVLLRDEQWIAAEQQFFRQLDNAVVESDSTRRDRSRQLERHQQQRPTTEDEVPVREAMSIQQQQLKAARDADTEAAAVLTSDDARLQENRQLAGQLQLQQEKAAPWLKLNELIGSREGDKFRMIAQRRTLDILLIWANDQLRRLAARYRLERLAESLNLVVIDEQMGDERRSVHSLSGGESFLVSLALALGLASLTSSRMRIESLFIDEGFGSLDPETLNTAMGALMHLESQGRKVGVISHVAEITDAMPVQVKIVRRRGGAARIEIQGADGEPEPGPEPSPSNGNGDIERLAARITEILQREQGTGSDKVSLYALRKELGCEPRQLKAAQRLLDGHVTVDGRSLRLA